jgi:hypothetical protein
MDRNHFDTTVSGSGRVARVNYNYDHFGQGANAALLDSTANNHVFLSESSGGGNW